MNDCRKYTRYSKQEKERKANRYELSLALITISVEDFPEGEKSYRELLQYYSEVAENAYYYCRGNVAGVEEDLSLGV
jgi:hypothetical protein